MLKKKSSYIIAGSNKRSFKCKCWRNRTMLFGSSFRTWLKDIVRQHQDYSNV